MTMPYKNVAVALIFSAILGPVGLLYASFWGGVTMIMLAIVVFSCKVLFPAVLVWIVSCVWAVGAVESYNRKIVQSVS